MHLTNVVAALPQLSCYTTNLVDHLAQDNPAVRSLAAKATRLAVRVDLPPGELAFSHHTRVDGTEDGRTLGYRSAADWETAKKGLLIELAAEERVLVVGNTGHMSWSAAFGKAPAPHWMQIRGRRDGRWLVSDQFAALTPFGEQQLFLGWLSDDELARALTPIPRPAPEVAQRDRLALGRAIAVPPANEYRWLVRAAEHPAAGLPDSDLPDHGSWILDPVAALTQVREVLVSDPTAAARYGDDLWAAGCHYAHRNALLALSGLVAEEAAAAATAAWLELPKTLRFAAQSAARGRPRTGVIEQALTHLVHATEALEAESPQEE